MPIDPARLVLLAALALLWAAPAAHSETLEEALAAAYGENPTLRAQRAQLRATDERVSQALGGWRPTLQFETAIGKQGIETDSRFFTSKENRTPESYAITLSQPLFRGGRTVSSTESAKNLVYAGRADLLSVEQSVLLDGTTAYLDVLRDEAVLDLSRNNERVLEQHLQATRDRFEVGDVTRTDVSQAEARLSQARAERIAAEGSLVATRSTYQRVIGTMPGTLTWPDVAGTLPASQEQAIEAARARHPTVEAARFRHLSSEKDIWTATGALLPEVSLEGSLERLEDRSARDSLVESARIEAVLSVPLYQSGAEYSRVREAKEVAGQRRLEIDEAERQTIEESVQAWEAVDTARAQVTAFQDQVAATEVALDGVQQEQLVGLRTVLDVLDAEQELFVARVNLVRAQRDVLVSSYRLKAAVGELSAADLGLPVESYDPILHYEKVRTKLIGLGGD